MEEEEEGKPLRIEESRGLDRKNRERKHGKKKHEGVAPFR